MTSLVKNNRERETIGTDLHHTLVPRFKPTSFPNTSRFEHIFPRTAHPASTGVFSATKIPPITRSPPRVVFIHFSRSAFGQVGFLATLSPTTAPNDVDPAAAAGPAPPSPDAPPDRDAAPLQPGSRAALAGTSELPPFNSSATSVLAFVGGPAPHPSEEGPPAQRSHLSTSTSVSFPEHIFVRGKRPTWRC